MQDDMVRKIYASSGNKKAGLVLKHKIIDGHVPFFRKRVKCIHHSRCQTGP